MCASAFRLCAAILGLLLPILAVQAAEPRGRPAYIVSDLHLNVGRAGGADWHPLEDFRWGNALKGLLERISSKHPDGVDFVIAGDFLELWQHPTIRCTTAQSEECGCTIEEMKSIVTDVLRGHPGVFAALGAFLERPANRVIVTPGNHDAALMVPELWALVRDAVPQGRDRFVKIESGTWISDDGAVAVEHGHQQTFDVNYFRSWPSVTRDCQGTQRMFRPWGENFVQSLYNRVETQFPIIDNMVPDSAGVALYNKYSEAKGTKSVDVAKFVIFNILQTSLFQKLSVLSPAGDKKSLDKDDLVRCRKCFKEELVLRADPEMRDFVMRQETQSKVAGATDGSLRAALAEQVNKMDDASTRSLCERIAVREGQLKFPPTGDPECGKELSMLLTNLFDPDGTHVLRGRIESIVKLNPQVSYYIYGHSHEARDRMAVRLGDGTDMAAFNTGAFQRLIDEKRLLQLKKDKETELELLARITHKDLKACYSLVAVTYPSKLPRAELRQWYMNEEDTAGKFLRSCSARCSAPPASCKALVPEGSDEIE